MYKICIILSVPATGDRPGHLLFETIGSGLNQNRFVCSRWKSRIFSDD